MHHTCIYSQTCKFLMHYFDSLVTHANTATRACISNHTISKVMEAKWGLIPDMGATITLRELVRIDVAKELTFTGKIIDGTQAENLGL
jgi:enoyl-CoA hydratase/carnithine racemase